ncbi:putative cation transport atpase protein [Neofusicoccum parvum UCRNP2]|uniref:Putative cation transport atpase protein n=1 Tax=Botryosphaeria parva (strain UCR-NP2) TaxID=1287680 RepID=R1GD95_BOTPV|nr:putative cation transport atpase protein [Neofusicoccum parvum UCRNP2]
MTCSGCGNKLQRSLESLPGVNNVSVNFIMKRADFEIDPSLTNAANTIAKAQQMTGFSLTKISTTDYHLEFLTTAASARILAAKTLPGVTSITPLKSSVLIAYNPTHTGARTLATSISNLTTGLAPPPTTTDPATSTHRATFRALTLKTLAAATLTIPIATLAWSPHLAPPRTRNPVSLALATCVQAIAAHEFYAPALRSLARRRALEMDALVAVSVSAAYAYSVVAFACGAAGRALATEPFFETGALLVALVLLGRLVGAWARVRAVAAVSSVERARKITDVVFDKTGTLTMQELNVVTEEGLARDHFESASLAKALVSGNNHPVSAAVAKHLETQDLDPPDLENSRVIPGSGITAVWNGFEIRAGNARWTRSEDHPTVRRLTSEGMTVLCVTKAGELAVVYGLKSVLRPEAVAVVDKLRGKNIAVHLVSGDERKAVEAVRAAVGIPPGNTVSRQTPAEKRVYVRQLMDDGKVTLFCGDGTNDAVAIAQADVGVQMGSSSDVSRATADVILLSGLEGIMFLLDISAASFHRIVFNFVWSAVYNVFAILLAAGAFVKK